MKNEITTETKLTTLKAAEDLYDRLDERFDCNLQILETRIVVQVIAPEGELVEFIFAMEDDYYFTVLDLDIAELLDADADDYFLAVEVNGATWTRNLASTEMVDDQLIEQAVEDTYRSHALAALREVVGIDGHVNIFGGNRFYVTSHVGKVQTPEFEMTPANLNMVATVLRAGRALASK